MSGAGAGAVAGAGAAAGEGTAATIRDQITRLTLPCEIRIVDEEKREIELCATSEAVDSYGTVFGYEASKAAFERWIGNVREMHERKAVGTRVAVRADDAAKKVYVRLRISKGAPDTWEKIKDGTLRGASIGASDVVWAMVSRGAAVVPVATSYNLVELSLVDNPANPDALGVTFVRVVADAVPVDAQLADLSDRTDRTDRTDAAPRVPVLTPLAPLAPLSPDATAAGQAAQIVEDAGSLSVEDMATRIAAEALARGRAQVLAGGGAAAAAAQPEPTGKQQRLAALGAPGYVGTVGTVGTVTRADNGPGSSFDGDGDHDGNVAGGAGDPSKPEVLVSIASGATDAAVMAPSPAGSVAHMAHSHHHTGRYDDPSDHRESSPHMHLDGTSHEHEHVMDHDHGGHEGIPAGHTHAHVHVPDHGHYFRVADGAPIDARLVGAEQVRTFEYVSERSFRAAGGVSGRALSAQQMRVARGAEMAAELNAIVAESRSLGPYSRNPDGPSDAGTPANAQPGVQGTEALVSSGGVSTGAVGEVDRDGKPIACEPEATTGTLDVSAPPDGWTGRAVAPDVVGHAVAEVTRQVAEIERRLAPLLGGIEARLARIEAQPLPGGPVLRAAQKVTALSPSGVAAEGGPADQLRALEALAGKLTDPQAQVAVATEMIRLGQEARGLSPAVQVMPRAGAGWGVK